MRLWAKVEQRHQGVTLILFRREVVVTPRGPVLEDVPVFVIEGAPGVEALHGKGVELNVTASSAGGLSVQATIVASAQPPVDPKLPAAKFSDPSAPKKPQGQVARGMGWKAQCQGTPGKAPVPGGMHGPRGGRRGGR